MARINLNLEQYDQEFLRTAMGRVEAAANIIKNEAAAILAGKVKETWKEHGGDPSWKARYYDEMVKTIRVVQKGGVHNIWVMAGTWRVWWATQLEYGRAGWKGGAKPFMRPAISKTKQQVQTALESDGGQTKGY